MTRQRQRYFFFDLDHCQDRQEAYRLTVSGHFSDLAGQFRGSTKTKNRPASNAAPDA
jgi:hypothetical protein